MPRARTLESSNQRTVANNQESGCLSGFLLPPLAVLLFGFLLAFFVRGLNPPVQAVGRPSSNAGYAGAKQISSLFTNEIQYWSEPIRHWAAAAGLDPNLVAVVMQIESCGDPRARSRVGAVGLFQVMPYHFSSSDNPYNPDTNALRGLAYLKRSMEAAGGNTRLALAGYNGGIGIIQRNESAWPSETARYVYYGYPIYQDADRGAESSSMLEEWYRRYGVNLCKQASHRLGIP